MWYEWCCPFRITDRRELTVKRVEVIPCGEGSSSRVHVERFTTGPPVVVKVYRSGHVAQHEVDVLRRLGTHPCLPSLLSVETDRIVMPFAGLQCLVEWIEMPTSRADRPACDHIATDVAAALAHMHDRRIAHLDVKADNIIVNSDGRATLVDFDLSHVYVEDECEHSLLYRRGSPAYVCPEMVFGCPNVSGYCADTWSFGVVFVALCFKCLPFHSATPPCDFFRRYAQDVSANRIAPCVALRRLNKHFDMRGDLVGVHDRVLDACLRWNPHHRGTMRDIAATLAAHVGAPRP